MVAFRDLLRIDQLSVQLGKQESKEPLSSDASSYSSSSCSRPERMPQKQNYVPWYDVLLAIVGGVSYFYFVFNCTKIINQGIMSRYH